MVIGHVGLSELRNTMAMSLMVEKRVYFPIYNGQRYRITAFYNDGQQLFNGIATTRERPNNKLFLDIDPDIFAHLEENDWIYFYRYNANNQYGDENRLGSATVAILRQVADIDFSGGARNFGSLSGGF
ncbi:hypothetical protein niasHS_008689 [Heterodera schachtii]|uniref:Uncharacterized protein n=1 Tax=Heterodera schachtii TaxID=97005 RepID=A0ABD2JAR3_HETSC